MKHDTYADGASSTSVAEPPARITAEMLLKQLEYATDAEGTLEILRTALVNARADGHDEICRHRAHLDPIKKAVAEIEKYNDWLKRPHEEKIMIVSVKDWEALVNAIGK